MTDNQAAQKQQSELQNKKEINSKDNSSAAENSVENDNNRESSWRPTDDQGEFKEPTENSTGSAGQSPAEQTQTGDPGRTPGKAEGEDFSE